MKYNPCRVANGPNGEPMTRPDGAPITFAGLLDVVLTSTTPPPQQRLAVYRIIQLIAPIVHDAPGVVAAGEPGPRTLELTAEQITLIKHLALECTALTTVAFGVLHDWLEGANEPH